MRINIDTIPSLNSEQATLHLINDPSQISSLSLSEKEAKYVSNKMEQKSDLIALNRLDYLVFVAKIDAEKNLDQQMEQARRLASDAADWVLKEKVKQIQIATPQINNSILIAAAEGLILSSYQFLKYKTSEQPTSELELISLHSTTIGNEELKQLKVVCENVYLCRDLVNEPVATLNTQELAQRTITLGEKSGIKVEVFSKAKIESLKMGGLLAVNKGSIDDPAFIVMEWKPENANNQKPIVLVGKGVVFDTGGMNIKTMPGSIDDMKSDMGGAATVVSTINAVAQAQLPLHVIALIPATDNRVNGNAYVPGDIITMFDGTTVEIINTDAEGRIILADALAYAKKYDPELVIDVATLTGAAAVFIGSKAVVGMGNANDEIMDQLVASGYATHERIAQLPFWEDFGEMIKSKIADIKNLGGREAGAITAGKFLEHFTDYPFVHLDIAGPAFIDSKDNYRPQGGTGVGVRLLFHFLNKRK